MLCKMFHEQNWYTNSSLWILHKLHLCRTSSVRYAISKAIHLQVHRGCLTTCSKKLRSLYYMRYTTVCHNSGLTNTYQLYSSGGGWYRYQRISATNLRLMNYVHSCYANLLGRFGVRLSFKRFKMPYIITGFLTGRNMDINMAKGRLLLP